MLRLPHLEPHYTTPRHTLLEYDKVNFWPKRIKKKIALQPSTLISETSVRSHDDSNFVSHPRVSPPIWQLQLTKFGFRPQTRRQIRRDKVELKVRIYTMRFFGLLMLN